jgi:molybdopterin biosynthesis enzyme
MARGFTSGERHTTLPAPPLQPDPPAPVSSFAALTPVDAVLPRLLASAPVPARVVPAAEAVGRVLAANLAAPGPVPGVTTALIDGVAVTAADLVGASAYAPAFLARMPHSVRAGDPLPPGADAVLPADAATPVGGGAEVSVSVAPGENVRRAGEDAAAGQILRRRGQILRPLDAALAALAGVTHAGVCVATVTLAAEPEAAAWAVPIVAAVAQGADLSVELPSGAGSDADLTVVLASAEKASGMGLALTEAEGVRLAARDGRPVLFAPPRPATLFVLARCCLAPALDGLMGRDPAPVWRRAPLLRKIASKVGLTEVALVRDAGAGLEPLAVGLLPLAALTQAEGVLVIPPESEGLPAGAVVDAYGV